VSHTDSSFLRNMVIIIVALVVFMVLIIIAANWLSSGSTNIQDDPMVQDAIEQRIAPVGQVNTGAVVAPAAAAAGPVDGKAIYEQACFACHGTGAAGAPKLGDSGAWSARIGQGMDTLNDHALNGFKGMPPRGGRADLDDDSVKAAVKYMVDNSK
jgi:cytochrome c5